MIWCPWRRFGTMCMYRLIAALSAVSPWLGLEPCKVGGMVPTENLISANKVKEGSCGKRITRFAGRRLLRLRRKQQRISFSCVADRAGVRRQHLYFKEGWVSGGPSLVAVMQPADLWQSHHSPHVLRLDRSRLGSPSLRRDAFSIGDTNQQHNTHKTEFLEVH